MFNMNNEELKKFYCGAYRKKICAEYPNIRAVDGFKLMHHSKEFYVEDWLHPNMLGCESYGRNLAKEIERLNF